MLGAHRAGILREVVEELHGLGLDVIEAHVETDGVVDTEVLTVRPRGATAGRAAALTSEKAQEVLHCVQQAINDPAAQVRAWEGGDRSLSSSP